MLSSNLLEILRTFDKVQIKKFGTFLISPYHNRNSNVVKLFNTLKTFYPEFQHTKLQREILWKSVFPEREYQYGVMKNLIFELQKLSEKFLSFENFNSNELQSGFNLLDALLDKNLISLFSKYTGHFKSHLERSKIDLEYFYYRYLIESSELNHMFLKEKKNRGELTSISRPNESLLIFFFLNFFNSNYNTLHDSVFYNSPYDRRYLNSVSEFFKNSPVRDNIFVSIFSLVIDTISFPDNESFFRRLKTSYAKNSGRLSREIKYNVLTALVNFCNYQVMKGNSKFINEQFKIYKQMIETGVYNNGKDNFINPYMYANIVSMAALLGKYNWAESFADKFRSKLNSSHRKQCFQFAMVSLNLKRKKFDIALDYLSKVKSGDVIDKITIRRFQMMLYYESGYFDELHSLIDSTKHFITNDNKTSAGAKNIFGNFLYFVKKFAEVKGNINNKKYDEYYLKNLKKELSGKEVSNKIWLSEKIDEIGKSISPNRKVKV